MSDAPHTALPVIDETLLTDVVRQDRRTATFDIIDWKIEPLSHEKIIDTTGGLFLVSGTGRDENGLYPWSVVLKIIKNPKEWEQAHEPRAWPYWKREMLLYESGLLDALPAGLCAPRCYGTRDTQENGWIWLEHIVETTERRWSKADYQLAARHAGRFAGAYLSGVPLPDTPWLCPSFVRSAYDDGTFWATKMDPATPTNAWQSPLVQNAFSDDLRAGVLQLWAEKHHLWEVRDRLPQVFCHNDFHRRNLLWRQDANGQPELVAIDWAFSGYGPLGGDLEGLVPVSAFFFEVEPEELLDLEATVLDGYVAGLREAGWNGDPRIVRLGYLLSAAFGMGGTLPGWVALMLEEEAGVNVPAMFGRPVDAVLAGWVTLTELMLEHAGEARRLMAQLGLANKECKDHAKSTS